MSTMRERLTVLVYAAALASRECILEPYKA